MLCSVQHSARGRRVGKIRSIPRPKISARLGLSATDRRRNFLISPRRAATTSRAKFLVVLDKFVIGHSGSWRLSRFYILAIHKPLLRSSFLFTYAVHIRLKMIELIALGLFIGLPARNSKLSRFSRG